MRYPATEGILFAHAPSFRSSLRRGYCVGPNEAEILRTTAIYCLKYFLYLLQ
jgi:hypothetical protein